MILGIDAGSKNGKVATREGVFAFDSCVGDGRERRLETDYPDMMQGVYQGKPFFAGVLAEKESYYPRRSMGLSKAHEDMKLRVLIALHRYSNEYENDLIVGQPIKMHLPDEKKKIVGLLEGEHTLILNGLQKTFRIRYVQVAAEGAGAFWCSPEEHRKVRIIDIGSGTVNIATIEGGFFIDRESDTLEFGAESHGSNIEAMTGGILSAMRKLCRKGDVIHIVGGVADIVHPLVSLEYPHAKVIRPFIGNKGVHPCYANAVGFYRLGELMYGGF